MEIEWDALAPALHAGAQTYTSKGNTQKL